MVFKKKLERLRDYVETEDKICKKIDERLRDRRSKRDFADNMEQAVLNQRNVNILILKDILQELETEDLKLEITFRGPKATDLPNLSREQFDEEGIRLESKGNVLQASLEANQSEFVVFWVASAIGITSGAITIANFIYEKLSKYKNTKMKVGSSEILPSIPKEELQKRIQEELKRLKEEIENIKNDHEK